MLQLHLGFPGVSGLRLRSLLNKVDLSGGGLGGCWLAALVVDDFSFVCGCFVISVPLVCWWCILVKLFFLAASREEGAFSRLSDIISLWRSLNGECRIPSYVTDTRGPSLSWNTGLRLGQKLFLPQFLLLASIVALVKRTQWQI
jgi:hypothetical protein